MLILLFLNFFNNRLIYKIRLSIKIQVFWSRDRKNLFLSNQELFLVGECQMSLDRDFLSLVFYKLLAKAFFKIVEHWSLQCRSFIMFMIGSPAAYLDNLQSWFQSWTPHSVERNKLEVIFVHSLLKASSFFPYGTVTRPFRYTKCDNDFGNHSEPWFSAPNVLWQAYKSGFKSCPKSWRNRQQI